MRKLLLIPGVVLLAACTFNPDLGDKYFPCKPGGTCPGECQCLEGQVCVPGPDQKPKDCAWCHPGYTICIDMNETATCAQLFNDPKHCGTCDHACPVNFVCEYYACTESCREGLIECERSCVNPETDPQNCGGCGHACGANQVCSNKTCEKNCPEDTENCYGACVDTLFDPVHCGGCEIACRLPNATADCIEGACVIRQCLEGYQDCDQLDQTGCEAFQESDPQNCGECGRTCDQPPSPVCAGDDLIIYLDTGECVSGECRYQSSPKPCLYGCENGACIDDPCIEVTCNLHQHCEDGDCVCDYLWGDCDTNNLNGCETYLDEVENCGVCEFNCGVNSVCVEGSCDCMFGFGNCNNNWGDGCEEDLLHNNQHCGTCNVGCTSPTDTCCNGSCVDTDTDNGNCGNCNTFCVGMKQCCGGTCTETQLDAENCGDCGNVCTFPNDACCWGSCVDLETDDQNCGDCNNACAQNIPCHLGGCGAQGIHCGSITCDFWTESCCYGSGGIACRPANDCTMRIVECDDDSDCGDSLYCCLVDESLFLTWCSSSCATKVCSSNEYCQDHDPDNPYCCPRDYYGQPVNLCQPEICQ